MGRREWTRGSAEAAPEIGPKQFTVEGKAKGFKIGALDAAGALKVEPFTETTGYCGLNRVLIGIITFA